MSDDINIEYFATRLETIFEREYEEQITRRIAALNQGFKRNVERYYLGMYFAHLLDPLGIYKIVEIVKAGYMPIYSIAGIDDVRVAIHFKGVLDLEKTIKLNPNLDINYIKSQAKYQLVEEKEDLIFFPKDFFPPSSDLKQPKSRDLSNWGRDEFGPDSRETPRNLSKKKPQIDKRFSRVELDEMIREIVKKIRGKNE